MFHLRDKTAIVTGGAHGIGRAIAEAFAAAGARVAIVDLDQEAGEAVAAGLRQQGLAATFLRADVSSDGDVRRVVQAVCGSGGGVDVLCNNAAYLAPFHGLLDAPAEEWARTHEVTLLGTVRVTREVLPLMVERKSGSIINISSVQGLVGGRGSAAYTTAKTGLIGLTRSLAYDYGVHNIRVNALCPGAISTRISPKPGDELYARQVSKTMLGRVGTPAEVAGAALFLASDASAYVTGAALPVDGGWTAM